MSRRLSLDKGLRQDEVAESEIGKGKSGGDKEGQTHIHSSKNSTYRRAYNKSHTKGGSQHAKIFSLILGSTYIRHIRIGHSIARTCDTRK